MYQPPDGRKRSIDDERRLNDAFASTFKGADGELVLAYLRNVTIQAIGGPGITPDHLMHLEGQRFAVALIEQRIQYGQQNLPAKEASHDRTRRR